MMTAADSFATIEARFHDWRYDTPKTLYGLVRTLRPAVCVEIGTYRGYAACYMARALQENGQGVLYCVDNFSLTDHTPKYGDPISHWSENLVAAGVRDFAKLIIGDSRVVPLPAQIDFAYIDGWHSYEVCKSDAERCIAAGAECVTFDDVLTTVGPRKYFHELRETGEWDCILLQRDGGLGIAYRRKPLRPVEFIQEIPDHPGTVLHGMAPKEARAELAAAAKVTGLQYEGML